MKLRRLAALSLLLFCAACGQGHYVDFDGGLAAYQRQKPVSGTFDALSFQTLSNPSSQKFAIDQTDAMLYFPNSGKSFIKAFALPPAGSGYHLVLRSYTMLHGLNGTALFYPIVTFLDHDKKSISASSPQELKLDWGGMGSDEPGEPARLKIDFLIAPQSAARYVIVHTDQQWIGTGSTPGLDKPALPAWAFALFGVGALVTPADYPASPIGLFEITLEAGKSEARATH
jgi:hypothetical protein